jgi:fatty-acyl-CoA synthase
VAIGGQETALFLTRGEGLARGLRLDRVLGVDRLPLSLGPPWGVNIGGVLGYVPFPVQVTVQLLPALTMPEGAAPDDAAASLARDLAAAVQSAFAALADERHPPRPLPRGASRAARVLAGAGLARPMRPDTVARAAWHLVQDGVGPAGAYEYSAARFPDAPAVIDDGGTRTFAELTGRVAALAAALGDAGVGPDDRVGVLARNHAGFVEAIAALSRLGADVVLLNTSFAGPQLRDVLEREHVSALVHDGEFAPLVADAIDLVRVVSWPEPDGEVSPSIDELVEGAAGRRPPGRAAGESRFVLLTSGTTGQPRGASRPTPRQADPLVALLSRIPLRQRDTTLVASPLFHAWGFAHLGLGMVLSSTLVLQRHFDPEATLAAIEAHRVRVLAAVPVMLLRLLDLPAEVRSGYDLSSLEVVASSGSSLPGDLATRFMDAFGDVLYNLYGSTEAAWAGIATPADLRAAPGTAGRPPFGTEVHIVDPAGHDLPVGVTGRILVHNSMMQQGPTTTGTGSGHVPPGLLATGDVGHVDELGRLFVDGRDDDMIVSGGENVYPQEVEDVLASHPSILEVVVIGVPDDAFGQRLKALVVRHPDARISAAEVRSHVRDRLARFKVPRDVEFIAELPRNSTGKVLRREVGGS